MTWNILEPGGSPVTTGKFCERLQEAVTDWVEAHSESVNNMNEEAGDLADSLYDDLNRILAKAKEKA